MLASVCYVLDLEDGLAGLDERFEQFAIGGPLDTFLVDREIEIWLQFGDLLVSLFNAIASPSECASLASHLL